MKVLAIKEKEVCLDGTEIKEFLLDTPVNGQLIQTFDEIGTLEYFSDFPRPFFRVTRPSQFIMKGVEGNVTFQVIFVQDARRLEGEIQRHIEKNAP